MNKEMQEKIKAAFMSINEQMEAHLIESIISLFNRGILVHYVRSPRQSISPEHFNNTIEAASGVSFEGRERMIELEKKLQAAEEENKILREENEKLKTSLRINRDCIMDLRKELEEKE